MYQLQLLDCTIRDGGYLNRWNFSDKEVIDCYKSISKAGYNYFEIGFKTNSNLLPDSGGKWMYCNEQNINKVKESYPQGCKIAVMAKLYTFHISDFKPKNNSNIDLVRLLLPKHDDISNKTIISDKMLKDTYNLATQILDLGYELSINIACGNLLSDNEITKFCQIMNPISNNIKCIYLADTYGGFDQYNIKTIFNKFKKNTKIPLAFHAHNNCQDGLIKSISAINEGAVMIDSCITGLGRGCGNLISEFLLLKLNKDITSIIEYADKYYPERLDKNNFLYFYGALKNCHPNYINYLLKKDINYLQKCDIVDKISKLCHEKGDFHFNKNLISKFFV